MSNALNRFGRVIQSVGDYASMQATVEAGTLGDALHYLSRDAFVVKETLTNRNLIMRDLMALQSATRAKQQNASKVRSSSNISPARVDEAIEALEEAKRQEEQLTVRFGLITESLVKEARAWTNHASREMRMSLVAYAQKHIEMERRVLSTLESVRTDVRAIDSSGGLSHLGRESMRQRQAAAAAAAAADGGTPVAGDGWSGVPRSSQISPTKSRTRPPAVVEAERIDARSAVSFLSSS